MESAVSKLQTRKITSRFLIQKGACDAQIARFILVGGDDLDLTEELCLKHAEKFNWTWAAYNLLTDTACLRYSVAITEAREAYFRRVNRWWAFWDTYENAQRDLALARACAFYHAWVSPENQIAEGHGEYTLNISQASA